MDMCLEESLMDMCIGVYLMDLCMEESLMDMCMEESLMDKLDFQLENGRRNNQNKIIKIIPMKSQCILLVYTVCTDFLTIITFLKLCNNNKCPIQINVINCTGLPYTESR